MPTIWCAISGHGFGHAAQVVPVLNELGRHVPHLAALLRTTVPVSFFQDRLNIPWSLNAVTQDVGCVQQGPLDIDIAATWEAHRTFHANWEARLEAEVAAMQAAEPTLILADTPYLALSAGKRSRIPGVLLASLTWNEILRSLDQSAVNDALVKSIELAYGDAQVALRMAPGLPLSGIRSVVDIGPIAEPAESRREALRLHLQISAAERLVLVGFGGIPLETLPWHHMEQMKGYHFLVDGLPPRTSSRMHSLKAIPFSFKTALASVDIVMTKPGYGTIVESVACGIPVVYVRRYNFAEEAPLVEFLHTHGLGRELSRLDFLSGDWQPTLDALSISTATSRRPSMNGASEAAKLLASYFHNVA